MNVVPLFGNSHVEIVGGVVQSATITDASGTRPDMTVVGCFFFFVDVIEAEGGRIGVWSGPSHEDAVREAEALSADFGPVRDLVMGGKNG